MGDLEKLKEFLFSVQDGQRINRIVQALNAGTIHQELRDIFSANDITLSAQASVEVVTPNTVWRITNQGRGGVFIVQLKAGALNIYGHGKELLLAEAAALLHDMYKCTDEHIKNVSHDRPNLSVGIGRESKNIQQETVKFFPNNSNVSNILGTIGGTQATPLKNLVDLWLIIDDNSPYLLQILRRCHKASHIEKEETDHSGKQSADDTRLSSPFGYELEPVQLPKLREFLFRVSEGQLNQIVKELKNGKIPDALGKMSANRVTFSNQALVEVVRPNAEWWIIDQERVFIIRLQAGMLNVYIRKDSQTLRALYEALDRFASGNFERSELVKQIKALFQKVLGETRRPENEVTLWDWSLIVAALYKAALAGALLGYKPAPNELRWRLLSVRYDGLSFLSEAHRIPDLLGRKRTLEHALDRVKELLEVEYPLGTEVYRDENGSLFVVPGCEKGNCTLNLLELQNEDGKSLRELIEEKFKAALEGEIVPSLQIDREPWWGQDPEWSVKRRRGLHIFNDELPPVAQHLKPVIHHPDPTMIAQEWNTSGSRTEVCTVCGLRPQLDPKREPGAEDRHICRVCLKRQVARVGEWLEHPETTVWIREVADIHGRVALIVGRFDLTHWLDGTLVRTLTVIDPAHPGPIPYVLQKIPSFVRLHRIWTATRRFWQEVCPVASADSGLDLQGSLVGQIVPEAGSRLAIEFTEPPELQPHYAYELVLEGGFKLSVVWDGRRFLTCENLEYVESERWLGRPIEDALQESTIVRVEQPVGYGAQNKVIGEFEVSGVTPFENGRYIPAIPLLAEPQTFMALVPAERAVEIVKAIQAKYEREMGKVRNRLPLHLGIVFAHRYTPLRALLDAGRRLLQYPGLPVAGWRLARREEREEPGDGHFAKTLHLRLELGERQVLWKVPLYMGDGSTKDVWYPYVFRHGLEPFASNRAFVTENPYDRDEEGTSKESWVVYVEDLKEGDTVYFLPATLDWIWLDTNARRFEIAYDAQGQRRSPRLKRRPYLLDELEKLEHIWETLETHLSHNQIHILRETIETKREAWGFPSPQDEGFRRFCRDLLAEVEWRPGPPRDDIPEERREELPWEAEGEEKGTWLERWADYAVRGWLADAVELYWEILKAREAEEVAEHEL